VATGLLAGNAAGAQTAVFIFFPLIFLAPTFLPARAAPGLAGGRRVANPTTYVLEAMRAMLIDGWDVGVLAAGFGVVAVLCAASLVWATRVAGRITARR
jgi:ABC-2 type transport system permease protein